MAKQDSLIASNKGRIPDIQAWLKARPTQSLLAKIRRTMLGFGGVIILTLVYAFYLAFIQSDRYAPEANVYIKSSSSSAPEGFSALAAFTGSSGVSDLPLVREYVTSADMLHVLDRKLNLKAHYQDKSNDFFSRLSPSASEEDFLAFYRSHLSVQIDQESGTLRVRAQAFTPEFALALTNALLEESEDFVNRVGQRIAASEVEFAENELAKAQARLSAIEAALIEFQKTHNMLSPTVETEATQRVVEELKAELVRLRTKEQELNGFLNRDAAELVATRNRIDALESQLKIEQRRLTGGGDAALAEVNLQFSELELRLKFATDVYKATYTGLEQARVEAYRKMKHLVVVQAPMLPEEASYPRRLYSLATLFVVLTLIYGIAIMVVATINEHRDI